MDAAGDEKAVRSSRGEKRESITVQVGQHVGSRVGERESIRREALGGRHELVETPQPLRHLGLVTLELEVDRLHRLGEAEDGLRVEAGEHAHERVEVLLLAERVGDGDELFEDAGAPFELGLDEDERGDPFGEVLSGKGSASRSRRRKREAPSR